MYVASELETCSVERMSWLRIAMEAGAEDENGWMFPDGLRSLRDPCRVDNRVDGRAVGAANEPVDAVYVEGSEPENEEAIVGLACSCQVLLGLRVWCSSLRRSEYSGNISGFFSTSTTIMAASLSHYSKDH